MNNPNEIYKFNRDEDPLEECPTLQEYIMDLIELLGNCQTELSYGNVGPTACHIESILEIVKEMAQGDWKIRDET